MPSGSRFPGGRHFTMFAMYTLLRSQVDHLKHIVQQVPRGAHKWNALLVLLLAGAFADEHYLRLFIADAEDEVPPRLAQRAAAAGGAVSF